MIDKIQGFFEKQAFGVCEWWGEKLNMEIGQIRLSFIYLSFLTFGSPIVIYLIMAFILKHKYWFKRRQPTIWEL
ncbi:PspC domain-containing protein [Salibacter sp.]|jgi:phage shock protein PspC (stress-responsive transcriptional regulator)|uniref:PspC domain-containing protein n=1 Tax=Salibacter sp. TaxID=2010995 RepID=UPI002870B375|nr:PspC family transcriptional regulator [Salibacter sp.]MDR9397951.1 PspC family transcriptional regulator [Salibacter sp.]MDR9486479.1 PspC family transcriptional regulator [Salibacter sp.]